MRFSDQLTLSDSLWYMIQSRQHESPCLRVLCDGLFDMVAGSRSLKLASEFPGNYFTFREKAGMISYIPKGRTQQINADGTWARKGRQSMKPARWIKSMLNPRLAAKFKDDSFAQFNAILLHEELRTKLTFKEVPVGEAYIRENFIRGLTSCMWGCRVAPFYEAFNCRVLVATTPQYGDGRLYVGRAIIWPEVEAIVPFLSSEKEKVTFMDRAYCTTEEVSMAFREYASISGWWRKRAQSADAGTFMKPNGEHVTAMLTAFTDRRSSEELFPGGDALAGMDFYPYLDTLFYGGDNWLSNNKGKGHRWIYRSGTEITKGTRTDASHVGQVRDFRGLWIEEDEAVIINGAWYHEDSPEIVRCAISGEFILRVDAFRIQGDFSGDDQETYHFVHRGFVRRAV